MISIDPKTTALVLIDLQNGIISGTYAPRSGAEVLETCRAVAVQFRQAGAPVVLVNVAWAADFGDALPQKVDQPPQRPERGLPKDWSSLARGLARTGDIRVTKRQWGAFHGTELDLQLRRRGIETIVLGGLVTNFGVESTARQAWERGYETILLKDACSAPSAELHDLAFRYIFPRIGRVTTSGALRFAAPEG